MALASLCSQLQKISYDGLRSLPQADYKKDTAGTPLSQSIKFQAFVVDHGVREGSDSEAQAVSKILEGREIPTKLLKIDWGSHEKPADLPNFESLARKHRFRALGTACKDLGIDCLLLAHHEDDQAETVLMRLIAGHRIAGLTGMPSSSEIPECFGMHGVHESGGAQNSMTKVSKARLLPYAELPIGMVASSAPLEIEDGGVKVYRPLLSFTKKRLIATCEENKMDWFEDHTNKDPTVTMRNTVRHIYANHALPAALSKPALLELSRKARAKKAATLEAANACMRASEVKLETRAGTLKVRFVNLTTYNRFLQVDKHAAAIFLRRIVMLITPREHVDISSLMGTVEKLFPESFWSRESSPPTAAFTVAGLHFKVLTPAKSRWEKPEWLISRELYKSTVDLPKTVFPANPGSTPHQPWSEWNLYDGRFWIRVHNPSSSAIVIRPLQEYDQADLRRLLSKWQWIKFRGLLSQLAPDGIRWTLPVIATRDPEGKETVLAFPTLDIGLPQVEKLVKWEVRYKKIERLAQTVLVAPNINEI